MSVVKGHLCFRSDGSSVQMDRDAMVFRSDLTEQDEGLYTCRASFYHHTAWVNIHVEVMSEDRVFGEYVTDAVLSIYMHRAEWPVYSTDCDHITMLRYVFRLKSAICGFDNCVCVCVFQHWWLSSASLRPQLSPSSPPSLSGCTGEFKCLHRWQAAARQVMCWRANEGKAAGAMKYKTNRKHGLLTQLTKTPVSCSYNPNPHKQEAVWLKQTGACITADR